MLIRASIDAAAVTRAAMRSYAAQYRYAIARALTETVRVIRDDVLPPAAQATFKGGATRFTQSGFYSRPALVRDTPPTAEVGVKDLQARYLRYQVYGGLRQPTRKALRLPSEVRLDPYGNLPAGTIAKLVARAKEGRRVTRKQGAKFGISRAVDLFYGEPPGGGRPAGIYKRVGSGAAARLVPVVVFPRRPAKYQRVWDFYAVVARGVDAAFRPAFDRYLALATAR